MACRSSASIRRVVRSVGEVRAAALMRETRVSITSSAFDRKRGRKRERGGGPFVRVSNRVLHPKL